MALMPHLWKIIFIFSAFTSNHQQIMEEEQRKMEEMITSTTSESSLANQSLPTTLTHWKLYHNPFFAHQPSEPSTYKHHHHHKRCFNYRPRAATSGDLGFNMAATTKSTKTEMESVAAQVIQLQAELELERKMRKKMESLAKKMAKELFEERRDREAAARLCDELASRVSCQKAEIDKIGREMEEERRMLRVADMIREERVQMKMEDAKIFYEEKMVGIELSDDQCSKPIRVVAEESGCSKEARKRWVSEPENPHIKRGIKGFVEFPRGVMRSNRSNSDRNYKLECQKAQLRILLKHKSPIQPNNLVIS